MYLLLQGIYTNPFDSEVMKEITATTSEQLTAHGKDWQCRKKVQRHWKTKFNPKFIEESTN